MARNTRAVGGREKKLCGQVISSYHCEGKIRDIRVLISTSLTTILNMPINMINTVLHMHSQPRTHNIIQKGDKILTY